jgi:GNAT superfamily N-acetyltransferase
VPSLQARKAPNCAKLARGAASQPTRDVALGALSIRKATAADSETARALVGELGYGGLDADVFAGGFAAVLADPAQEVWLAEQDGRVVALMSLARRPQVRLAGFVLTIDELVVTEAARGAGIGTKLLDFAKGEAVRIGARRLELHTARGRPSYARGFYAKNGFVNVDSAVLRWEGSLSIVTR